MDPQSILPEADRRTGQKRLIGMSVLSAASDAFITVIAPLFLLSIGASSIHIGLLATSEHVQKVSRFVGLRLVRTFGKARLMALSRLAAALPVVALVLVASYGISSDYAVILTIGVLAVREFLRQMGNTVWWPLIQDNTAGDPYGAFMARLRIRQNGATLLLPIAVGWYLGTGPSSQRFALPFALGIAASLMGARWAWGVSEGPPLPHTEGGVVRRLFRAYRLPSVRWLSLLMFLHRGITAATYPLWVVVLTRNGMSAMVFVWLSSAAAFGQVTSLTAWGRWVDHHGSRPTLSLALSVQATIAVAWIWLPAEPGSWQLIWGFMFYIAWGVTEGGMNLGRTHAMMGAVSRDHQVEGFNAIMYASAVGGMIGGIGGGVMLDWLGDRSTPGFGLPADQTYLLAAQASMFVVYWVSRRLVGADAQPTLRSLALNRLKRKEA